MKRFLLSIFFIVLLAYPVNYSYAQNEGIKSATPLSFIKTFPIVQREGSLRASGISIGVKVNSKIVFREDMVLLTRSSYKYAEKGKSTTLGIDVSNAISLLELTGDVTISISHRLGSIDIPVKVMDIKYAVPETMGTSQYVIMEEHQLYSGTIPGLGIQVSIYVRPVVRYTPTLSGSLMIQGPASSTPTSLNWNQESVATQIDFSESEPVSVFLSDPRFTLNDFRFVLEIYAIIAVATTPSIELEIVNLGDYSLSSSTVNLISFEPNYYVLYTELQKTYSTLASTLQEFRQSLDNLSNRLDQLDTGVSQIGGQTLSIGAIVIAVVSLVIALYSASKSIKG